MTDVPDIELRLCGEKDPLGDPVHFGDWLLQVMADRKPLAIDTETTGLEWWTPNFTRLVQFGTVDSGWAIPVSWYGKVIEVALQDIVDARYPVVFHNAKFDMHALEGDGFPVPSWRDVDDTKIMHHILHPARNHSLKNLAVELLGPWAKVGQTGLKAAMRRNGWDWATVPVDLPEYWAYGVLDTCLTARIVELLGPRARSDAYEREMRYQAIMYAAERRGMKIDTAYACDLSITWEQEIMYLGLDLMEAGIANPNSNRMVEAALADLGWEAAEFTATGQAKLDGPVLKRMVELGGPTGEVAEKLIRFKRLRKWSSTYLTPFIASGGVVHPSINTMAARTGRSSITDPPLQTLPHTPDIRTAVIPSEGNVLWSIDYAGQEARIFASYAQEQAMTEVFTTGDGDLHAFVARMVYGDGFTKEQRSIAKTVNFALLYGAGPRKMAASAGVEEMEIKRFLATYHKLFPSVDPFMKAVQRSVVERATEDSPGWVTTRGGRNVTVDPGMEYAGVNYLIQGSGADVLKDAVINLEKFGLSDFIVVPVHDELLFDFPAAEAAEMAKQAQEVMTNTEWFSVPIVTDSKGPLANWGDAYR